MNQDYIADGRAHHMLNAQADVRKKQPIQHDEQNDAAQQQVEVLHLRDGQDCAGCRRDIDIRAEEAHAEQYNAQGKENDTSYTHLLAPPIVVGIIDPLLLAHERDDGQHHDNHEHDPCHSGGHADLIILERRIVNDQGNQRRRVAWSAVGDDIRSVELLERLNELRYQIVEDDRRNQE